MILYSIVAKELLLRSQTLYLTDTLERGSSVTDDAWSYVQEPRNWAFA